MKVERSTNEHGEPVISVSVPIPSAIDPKDYEVFAEMVSRDLSRRLSEELRRSDRDWLKLETKG